MGWIAVVKSYIKAERELVVDPGGGANITVERYSAPGDDSPPLPGDTAALIPTQRNGSAVAVAYSDGLAAVAGAGEKRIYARSSGGAAVAELYLKNDGTVVLENANGKIRLSPDGTALVENGNGKIEMEANGEINMNGVLIDSGGNVTLPGTLIDAAGIGLATHKHSGVTTGSGTSGVPVP